MAFALVRLAPGGPFDKDRQPASPEIKRNLRAKYHLDEPVWKQYGRYLAGLVRGDFGPSMKYRDHSVNDIIRQGLPVSMILGLLAFCFAQAIGIPLGFYTAVRTGTWQEWFGSLLAIIMVCVPALVVAPILVMVFAIQWGLLPVALWDSPLHAILPTVALGLFFSGRVARLMREGMLTTLKEPFVMAARAKGLSDGAVLLKHAFRLGVLPVVSYSGPMLADLLTGSFVVENVFRIPGIGVFLVNSSLNRDYTMVVGLVVLYAVLLLVLNLAVDFFYTVLDPRVKYE
jgi:oligopeptide transport system permease protein